MTSDLFMLKAIYDSEVDQTHLPRSEKLFNADRW